MDRYPSYHQPLQIPDIDVGQPLQFPRLPQEDYSSSKGRSSSNGKETKEDSPEGLTGDVNYWHERKSQLQNELSSILEGYGIGNMAYAEKYDKDYQQKKAELNQLTSGGKFNEFERRKVEMEDFKKYVTGSVDGKGTSRAGEIDLQYWRETGQIRNYNDVLNDMEQKHTFDFERFDERPDLTSLADARSLVLDAFNKAEGVDGSGVTKATRIGEAISNGQRQISSVTSGGQHGTSNDDAMTTVLNQLLRDQGTSIRAGFTRGFIATNAYQEGLKNHKGKDRYENTEEFNNNLAKYINQELAEGKKESTKVTFTPGVYEEGVKYVNLPDDYIKANRAENVRLGMLTGTVGVNANAQLESYGEKLGLGVNDKSVTKASNPNDPRFKGLPPYARGGADIVGDPNFQPPPNAIGYRSETAVRISGGAETYVAFGEFADAVRKAKNEGAPIALSKFAAGSWTYNPENGAYLGVNSLPGWSVVDYGRGTIVGDIKPQGSVKQYVAVDGTRTLDQVVFDGSTRARTDEERVGANALAMAFAAKGDYVSAHRASNTGIAVSGTLEIAASNFNNWALNQTVSGTARYEVKDYKAISFKELKPFMESKGYRAMAGNSPGTLRFEKDGKQVNERYAKQLYADQTAKGAKENKAAQTDYVKKVYVGVKSPQNGYTEFNGIYVLDEYLGMFNFNVATEKDGVNTITMDTYIGAEGFISSTPEGMKALNEALIQDADIRTTVQKQKAGLLNSLGY